MSVVSRASCRCPRSTRRSTSISGARSRISPPSRCSRRSPHQRHGGPCSRVRCRTRSASTPSAAPPRPMSSVRRLRSGAQALGLHGRPLRDRLPVRADDDPLRAARDPVGMGDLPTRVCPTRGGHAPRLVLLDHRRRPHRADDGQLALAPGRHQRSDRGRRVDRERRARHDPVCRAARRVQDDHRTRHGHGPRKPDPSVPLLSWASAGSRG